MEAADERLLNEASFEDSDVIELKLRPFIDSIASRHAQHDLRSVRPIIEEFKEEEELTSQIREFYCNNL